jgi:hypothetical protein
VMMANTMQTILDFTILSKRSRDSVSKARKEMKDATQFDLEIPPRVVMLDDEADWLSIAEEDARHSEFHLSASKTFEEFARVLPGAKLAVINWMMPGLDTAKKAITLCNRYKVAVHVLTAHTPELEYLEKNNIPYTHKPTPTTFSTWIGTLLDDKG